jgi:hypothetical protein
MPSGDRPARPPPLAAAPLALRPGSTLRPFSPFTRLETVRDVLKVAMPAGVSGAFIGWFFTFLYARLHSAMPRAGVGLRYRQ